MLWFNKIVVNAKPVWFNIYEAYRFYEGRIVSEMRRQSRMLAVGLALGLILGCQSIRGNLSPQGVISLGTTKLTLRLPQASRQVAAIRAAANYHLTILGADVATPQTTTVSQAEDASTIEVTGAPGGINRIIVLQALDSTGAEIPGAAWMAVTNLESAQNQIDLTAATTAVGRIWRRWLETDHKTMAANTSPSDVLVQLDKIKTATAVAHYSLINTQKWADQAASSGTINLGTVGFTLTPGTVDVTINGAPVNVPAELWIDDPASPLQSGVCPNTTLTNGRYRITPVAPGNWVLWASVPGFGVASCSLNVPANATASLTFPGWESEATLPAPVGNSACVADDRYIYLIGGVCRYEEATSSCWQLDTQAAIPTWQALPPLPYVCEGAKAAIVEGKLYVVGGVNVYTVNTNACVLDLSSKTEWISLPSLPGLVTYDNPNATRSVAQYGAIPNGAFAENGKLVAYYSIMCEWVYSPPYDRGHAFVYTPGTPGSWAIDPAGYTQIRTPRERAGFSVFGQQVVVAGGDRPMLMETGGGNYYQYTSTSRVEAFDRITRAWKALPDLPTPRSELALASAGDRLYAVGGTDYGEKPLNVVEYFNSSTQAWKPGPPLKVARSSFGLVYVGGKLWAIGGSPSRVENSNWYGSLVLDSVESLRITP